MPKYGFGSWLKRNSSWLGTLGGAGLGAIGAAFTATGIGAPLGVAMMGLGASAGGSFGSSVSNQYNQNQAIARQDQLQSEAAEQQRLEAAKQQNIMSQNALVQSRMGELTPQQSYGSFAKGGMISSYNKGGFMEGVSKNPDVTYFANGGTHESSKLGGIPQGQKGLVEEGEFKVKFGKDEYIFSNRF